MRLSAERSGAQAEAPASSGPLRPRGRGRRSSRSSLVLAGALVVSALALAMVAARGPAPPRTLPEQVHAIGASLRCPVCQNLSVADSPSRTAQQMRAQIRLGLQEGRSPEEIRAGFAAAYGDWILLSPPKRGINLVAWVGPALLLAVGLVLAAVSIRRWTAGGSDGGDPLSEEDRRLLAAAMASEEEPE